MVWDGKTNAYLYQRREGVFSGHAREVKMRKPVPARVKMGTFVYFRH
jgi:hypothetical protein